MVGMVLGGMPERMERIHRVDWMEGLLMSRSVSQSVSQSASSVSFHSIIPGPDRNDAHDIPTP